MAIRTLVALETIADITNGVFVASSDLRKSEQSVPVVSVRSLTTEGLDPLHVDHADIGMDDYRRCKIEPGDVLVSSRSTSMLAGVVPASLDDGIINSTLIGIRLHPDTIHPRLLVAWMQSGLGRLHFGPLSQSTTMQMNVTVKELRTLPVPIFTQEEQAALVDTLEQSDIAYQTATAAAGQRREIALQVVTDVLIGKTKIKHG